MNNKFFNRILIVFLALVLFSTNAKSQAKNITTRATWDVLYTGTIPLQGQALYVYNGVIHLAVWNLTATDNEMGKLYRYMPNGSGLMEFNPITLEMPKDIFLGYQNFLGFTSDGTYIYGVNMSNYIFKIDPAQQKVVDVIQLKPAAGFVAIAYDSEKDGFWGTDLKGEQVWFVDREGRVYDGNINESISMGYDWNGITGLAYDDITEGGPYLWTASGGVWENGIAHIRNFHMPSGEYTSEIVDVKDILGFGSVIGANMGSLFMYQDYERGKQVLVGTLPSQYTLFALDMGDISGKGSPRKADNLTAIADDNAAFGATLSWNNPEKLIDGSDIDALTKITLSKNGEVVYTINNPEKGAQETWRDTDFSEKGLYDYSVVAYNSAGNGLPANKSVFIGEDTPGQVRNVKVHAQNSTTCKVSWDVPTTGKHEGWFNQSQLSYKVVRMPDEKVIVHNTISKNVIDNTITEKNNYTYLITSYTNAGEGSTASTPKIMLGDAFTTPWSDDFSDQESFAELWTLIDGNDDNSSWNYLPGYFGADHRMVSSGIERTADDWMITPALRLEAGKEYRLRWNSYAKADSDITYYVTIGSGKTADDQGKILTTVGSSTETTQKNQKFTVNATDDYYIGFHSVAFSDFTIHISKFSIVELPDYDLEAKNISAPTEMLVDEEKEVKVTITNEGRYDITDEFDVQLWAIDENNTKIDFGTKKFTHGLLVNASTDIAFNVTFENDGIYNLYVEVACESDKDNDNDNIVSSYPIEVNTLGTVKIQVGEIESNNTSNILPFNPLYSKSASQSVYLANEIGTTGVINKLAYHYDFEYNDGMQNKPLQIYITTTEFEDVSLEWIVKDTLLVFDGTITIPGGRGVVTIPLDNPYLYNGGNIAITHMSNGVTTANPLNAFYYTFTDRYGASRIMASSQETIDLTQIGRLVDYIPVTTFVMNERGASLEGTVKSATNEPIAGVQVQVEGTNWTATTDANGKYAFPFIPANKNSYTILAAIPGYTTERKSVSVETSNQIVDITLTALSTIQVSGKIVGEDTLPLKDVNMLLSGNDNYQLLTNTQGEFTFSGVFAPGDYVLEVYKQGYIGHKETITVGATNHAIGDITLSSCIQNAPRNLTEKIDAQEWYKLNLQWLMPMGSTAENHVTGYHVYRNNQLIAKIPESTTQFKELVSAGTYLYEVSAIWSTGCESSRVSLSITKESDPWEETIVEFPFYDGFESGKIESYWREKYLNNSEYGLPWAVVQETPADFIPAYEGDYFVTLLNRTSANNCSRLITPVMDLTGLEKPQLNFWHLMPTGFLPSDKDALILYYKNSIDGAWIPFEQWTSEVKTWTERKINLPNPTSTYWIAFEGITFYGYGVSLDNVKVFDAKDVSISDVDQSDSIAVYPNPAKEKIAVKGENIKQVKVYNLTGGLIESIQLDSTNKEQTINLGNYEPGVYLFRFEKNNQDSEVKRIVIRK